MSVCRYGAFRALALFSLLASAQQQPVQAVELLGPSGVNFRVGDGPRDVRAGDLNNDGFLDLLIANRSSGTVSIALGDGLGSFDVLDPIGVGEEPTALATADFDDDGLLDFAVANEGGDEVVIVMVDGAGHYRVATRLEVGRAPRSLAVDDFDCDGNFDLATADSGIDNISVWLGDGQGGYSSRRQRLPTGNGPVALVAAHLDADAVPDLAAVSQIPPTLTILYGDGTGGFVLAPEIALADNAFPVHLAAGDLNGDDITDLAVAAFARSSLIILLGDHDQLGDARSTFVPSSELPLGNARPRHVLVTDLDEDGYPDLLSSSSSPAAVTVLLGKGSASFDSIGEFDLFDMPSAVAVGDYDLDGALDGAVANLGNDSITIVRGNGYGGFRLPVAASVGDEPRAIAIGDYSGDLLPDVAVANSGDDTLTLLQGTATGELAPLETIPTEAGPWAVIAGEWNVADPDGPSDPALDLAVANKDGGSVTLLEGNGSGAFPNPRRVLIDGEPRAIAAGDIDGDGYRDLVTIDLDDFGATVLLGDGTAEFPTTEKINTGPGHGSIAIADFDGGGDDLALTHAQTDQLRILQNAGAGSFGSIDDIQDHVVGRLPEAVVAHDLDGNGTIDLATANAGDDRFPSTVSILSGDGSGGFTNVQEVLVPRGANAIVVGDFNGDTRKDLAVGSSGDHIVAVLLGDGELQFTRALDLVGLGPNPRALGVADFDGDGYDDLVAASWARDRVVTVFNQLEKRADLNASNRVDGFDLNTLARSDGCSAGSGCYSRKADLNLDGMVDGEDLATLCKRWGELNVPTSPLRPVLDTDIPPPGSDSVVFELDEDESRGDVIALRVVMQSTVPVGGAQFSVRYDPAVLGYSGFRPGTYPVDQGVLLANAVLSETPGLLTVSILQLTGDVSARSGTLLRVFFRARAAGQTQVDFEQQGDSAFDAPALLDADHSEIPGSVFDGATVKVNAAGGGPPGRRIGVAPSSIDFGTVSAGDVATRPLRISNFGFSELTIHHVSSDDSSVGTAPQIDPMNGAARVGPYSFVELTVRFAPTASGEFDVSLDIVSDDLKRNPLRIPIVGRATMSNPRR